MAKRVKKRVSNSKTLNGKPLLGEKRTGINTYIRFYRVEEDDKYDIGDEEVIQVEIYKALGDTKKNVKNLTSPVIRFFEHQGYKVVHML